MKQVVIEPGSGTEIVLSTLADGRFHSGETMAQAVGLSRTAIWRLMRTLNQLGLDIQAVRGKGYRLSVPFVPLAYADIVAALATPAQKLAENIEVQSETGSTNDRVIEQPDFRAGLIPACVCLAEYQHVGRGRQGRHWQSPYGAGINLSLGWRFDNPPDGFSGLGLAAAVALMRALESVGITGAGLKWPNDVIWEGRKLAGLLIEVQGEISGQSRVVIGIGINVRVAPDVVFEPGQPWADLAMMGNESVDRNILAAAIISELVIMLEDFTQHGFTAWQNEYARFDRIVGKSICVQQSDASLTGIARGIDHDGALLLDTGTGMTRILSGDVSLRIAT